MDISKILESYLSSPEFQTFISEEVKKGVKKSVEDYFTSYNSDFRRQFEKALSSVAMPTELKLPDIVAKMNEALNEKSTKIANTAVAKTYIPLYTEMLLDIEQEITMSKVLKKIIDACGATRSDSYDYSLNLQTDDDDRSRYYLYWRGTLQANGCNYEISFSQNRDKDYFEVNHLPRYAKKPHRYIDQMTVNLKNGTSLQMPFTPNVLEDPVMRVFANLILNDCHIHLDVDDFDDDMFECAC